MAKHPSPRRPSFDAMLSDETMLEILSYLDASDLSTLHRISSNFYRLTNDAQLWKRLFYRTFLLQSSSPFPLPTHRKLLTDNSSASNNSSYRPIVRLPNRYHTSRNYPDPIQAVLQPETSYPNSLLANVDDENGRDNDSLDWKALYKVSRNWQKGNFVVSELLDNPRSTRASFSSHWLKQSFEPASLLSVKKKVDPMLNFNPADGSLPRRPLTLVRASPNLIFTSHRSCSRDKSHDHQASHLPNVQIYLADTVTIPSKQTTDPTKREPLALLQSDRLDKQLALQGSAADQVYITEMCVESTGENHDLSKSDGKPTPAATKRKRKDAVFVHDSELPDSGIRLFVSYSTGHFSLFRVLAVQDDQKFHIQAREEYLHVPNTCEKSKLIVASALRFPVLITCAQDFSISIYQLFSGFHQQGKLCVKLIQQMSSYRCYWPACIKLKPIPFYDVIKRTRRDSSLHRHSSQDPTTGSDLTTDPVVAFRLTVAYSTPAYPASWTVGLQEIVMTLPLLSTSSTLPKITSRHATACQPATRTPIDSRGTAKFRHSHSRVRPRLPWTNLCSSSSSSSSSSSAPSPTPPPEASNRTTSLTYEDPFVVVGSDDNLLEVYQLFGATNYLCRNQQEPSSLSVRKPATATPTSSSPSSSEGALRLLHRRILYGHTGRVQSIALEDGRCVSGSSDGSIMVWSLENDRINETNSSDHLSPLPLSPHQAVPTTYNHSHNPKGLEPLSEKGYHFSHIITLQTPCSSHQELNPRSSFPSSSSSSSTPTLGQLFQQLGSNPTRPPVIQWVSTTFDKIVSVVESVSHSDESVQVWNFAT